MRVLTDNQKKYATIDVIVSLLLYLELEKKPDLTRRLDANDVLAGLIVDLVPQNGSVACMATRAATVEIVDMEICNSPDGILPKKARRGDGCVTVKIQTVYYLALRVPRYRVKETNEHATLKDLSGCHAIVPLKML